MNEEEKRGAIECLQSLLKQKQLRSHHKAIRQALKDQLFYTVEDMFLFDSQCCETTCLGDCCTNTKFLAVSPIDVDWFMLSNVFENQNRAEIVEKYVHVYIGAQSLVPQAVLKTQKSGKFWVCPFFNFQSMRNGLETSAHHQRCILEHGYKPKACLLDPLNYYSYPKEGTMVDFFTLHPCLATKTTHMVAIKDHIGNFFDRRAWTDRYDQIMLHYADALRTQFSEPIVQKAMTMVAFKSYMEGFDIDTADATLLDLIAYLKQKGHT